MENMAKITYENKVALNVNNEIADVNNVNHLLYFKSYVSNSKKPTMSYKIRLYIVE